MANPIEDLLSRRIVVVTGPITDRVCDEVCAQLLFLQSLARRIPIELRIASPGGPMLACLAIRDLIDELAPPVHTHAFGHVEAGAAVVLAHGARGNRSTAPHARIALSPVTANVRPGVVQTFLAADTGQSFRQIDEDLRASRQFSADEARAYGLVDTVEVAGD